jgi:hypothetical protein
MDLAPLATLTAALMALVLLVALAVALAGRRRLERDLAATRADLEALSRRLDELVRRPASAPVAAGDRADYVITTLPDQAAPVPGDPNGGPADGQDADPRPSRTEFASIAVTESVVKVASFAYGVRRALSPESRNRMRFEMGREVKRARRQRRRDDREARRRRGPGPDAGLEVPYHDADRDLRADDAA